jgi:hypothetical protein
MEGATGANLSNFMGQNAGYQATDAYQSNFFSVCWSEATNAYLSNFING